MSINNKSATKIVYIKIIIVLGILILFVINIIIYFDGARTIYHITSDGISIFSISDGTVSFIINNNIYKTEKDMGVYTIHQPEGFRISASDFVEDSSGKIIKSNDILFNNNKSELILQNITQGVPASVTILVDKIDESGTFRGHFFISDNVAASIPITIDIKPTFDRIIIWVVNGIAVAIIFWKFIKFVNGRYELKLDSNQTRYKQDWTAKPKSFKKFVEDSGITAGTIAKNAILDAGSIIFGIVVGTVALLDNAYINNLRILDPSAIIVLFGIGLGIGSLKEYVYLRSEPDRPA